jgi:ubiquinone/menaquinone biosynthesis C-methylase UbiE
MGLYRLLENRHVYDLIQTLLAPGATRNIREKLFQHFVFDGAKDYRVLELGCGTGTFSLDRNNIRYVGTDINGAYFAAAPSSSRMKYEVMDATRLAFPDSEFDLVYSCGLYHHLSDDQTRASIQESLRVTKPGGTLIWLDNIWPSSPLNVPARFLRQFDRGKHVRTRAQILGLLADSGLCAVSAETFYYTSTGLEGIIVRIDRTG